MFTKWQAGTFISPAQWCHYCYERQRARERLGIKSMVSGNHVTTLQLRAPAEAKKERRRTLMLCFCELVCQTSDASSVVASLSQLSLGINQKEWI